MRFVLTALTLLALPAASRSQVPTTTLGKSLARSSDGFTDIRALQELADGRVVLLDFGENRVNLVDFSRGSIRSMLRLGEGPAELPLYVTLVPWAGDSLLIGGHHHALKMAPTGEIVDKIAMPFLNMRSYSAVTYTDRAGHVFGEAPDALLQDKNGEFIAPLGSWIIRSDFKSERVDSLVRFSVRDPKQPVGKPWRPYPKRDAYTILPTGDIMLFRAQGFLVELWREGKVVSSHPVAYKPIPIAAAERDAYRDEKLRRPAGGGGARGAPTPGAELNSGDRSAARRALAITDDIFPPELSPFIELRATVYDRAHNEVWLARSYPARSTERPYDVFDARGNLVRHVTLKNRGTVLGFGKGVVYVSYPDEDDVLWVEKVAEK